MVKTEQFDKLKKKRNMFEKEINLWNDVYNLKINKNRKQQKSTVKLDYV